MALNLEAEIAGRLGVRAEDVRPVLETVIQRVRQQVAHYGYARLAGLGTFRGQDGSIVFEPEAGLAEAVNVRFAGLGELNVEDLSPSSPATKPPFGEEPQEAISSIPPLDEWDEPSIEPEGSSGGEFDEYGIPEDFPAASYRGGPEALLPDEAKADFSEDPAGDDFWSVPVQDEGFAPGKEAEEERWLAETGAPGGGREEGAFVDESPLAADETEETRWRDEASALYDESPTVRWDKEPLSPGERADAGETGSFPDFNEPELPQGDYEELSAEEDETTVSSTPGGVIWQDDPEEGVHPLGPMPPSPYEEADYSFIDDRGSREETPRAWMPLDEDDDSSDQHPPAPPMAPDRSAKPHERVRQQALKARHAGGGTPPNRSGMWLGLAVVLLIAAAAVAYFTLWRSPAPEEEPAIVEQSEGDAFTDSAAAQTDTSATVPDRTAVVPDTAGGAPGSVASAVEEPASTQSTPLRSANPINPSQGGYTVIVGSETSRSTAEGIAERYRRQGFRTGILEAREGGVTRYRVGVGQFSSMSEAERTRTQLAGSDLPQDAWVRRVR